MLKKFIVLAMLAMCGIGKAAQRATAGPNHQRARGVGGSHPSLFSFSLEDLLNRALPSKPKSKSSPKLMKKQSDASSDNSSQVAEKSAPLNDLVDTAKNVTVEPVVDTPTFSCIPEAKKVAEVAEVAKLMDAEKTLYKEYVEWANNPHKELEAKIGTLSKSKPDCAIIQALTGCYRYTKNVKPRQFSEYEQFATWMADNGIITDTEFFGHLQSLEDDTKKLQYKEFYKETKRFLIKSRQQRINPVYVQASCNDAVHLVVEKYDNYSMPTDRHNSEQADYEGILTDELLIFRNSQKMNGYDYIECIDAKLKENGKKISDFDDKIQTVLKNLYYKAWKECQEFDLLTIQYNLAVMSKDKKEELEELQKKLETARNYVSMICNIVNNGITDLDKFMSYVDKQTSEIKQIHQECFFEKSMLDLQKEMQEKLPGYEVSFKFADDGYLYLVVPHFIAPAPVGLFSEQAATSSVPASMIVQDATQQVEGPVLGDSMDASLNRFEDIQSSQGTSVPQEEKSPAIVLQDTTSHDSQKESCISFLQGLNSDLYKNLIKRMQDDNTERPVIDDEHEQQGQVQPIVERAQKKKSYYTTLGLTVVTAGIVYWQKNNILRIGEKHIPTVTRGIIDYIWKPLTTPFTTFCPSARISSFGASANSAFNTTFSKLRL